MPDKISAQSNIQRSDSSRALLKNSQHQLITVYSNTGYDTSSNKTSSVISVDHQAILSTSHSTIDDVGEDHDQIKIILNSTSVLNHVTAKDDYRSITKNEHQYSLTYMLLVYAQQDADIMTTFESTRSYNNFSNVLNILELYFNIYADDERQICFEGIFQILYDFKEQITELALIETMQLLKIDPFISCNFEDFILILCHLPPTKQDSNDLFIAFNELDYNKDFYITAEDIRHALPHLISRFDEEIIQAAIHAIDIDHDNDRLSYFDFVTSLLLLQECEFNMKKTTLTDAHRLVPTEQRK
ncbi:unnamed protein product [Rotaria socialis]|uniref:EF-hand domain-containing protein n=1 Tax=Rotaria socialis TaxID=392032 RepID=A0A818U4X8_9BILA|nr:unnamed protein product [Rotaria socialis]CAF4369542.1 unnamed protein product [Rotaria socialis]